MAQPQRQSDRLADRVPQEDARYLNLAFYDVFRKQNDQTGDKPTEEQVKAFWTNVLLPLYFTVFDDYMVGTEVYTDEGQKRADMVVFYCRTRDAQGDRIMKPYLVLEFKGATPSVDTSWHAAPQCGAYARELCRKYKVPGMWIAAAQGRLVKFFECRTHHEGYVPLTSTKANHRLSPMDVLDDHRYVHEMLCRIIAKPLY